MGDIHPLSLPIADNVRNVLPIRRNALVDERPAAVLTVGGEGRGLRGYSASALRQRLAVLTALFTNRVI